MPTVPPEALRDQVHQILAKLLSSNPLAASSESYVQHHVEFELLAEPVEPRYVLRIGINYHGSKVQHLTYDGDGVVVGWNPKGDALGIGKKAKMLLAGSTIFERDDDEHSMSDCKIGGGAIPDGSFVRMEFKVRGWAGKTKNLDGKQLLKDFGLLRDDKADLLVISLSEIAHRKWRGEGPKHQVARRTGCIDFAKVLVDPDELTDATIVTRELPKFSIQTDLGSGDDQGSVEPQRWCTSTQRVIGGKGSNMPGALHFVTLVWRCPDGSA